MPEAAVVITGRASGQAAGRAAASLLGLTLLERAVLSLHQGGVGRILVADAGEASAALSTPAVRRASRNGTLGLETVPAGDADRWKKLAAELEGPVLFLREGAVFDPRAVGEARADGLDAERCTVFVDARRSGALEGAWTGLWSCPAGRLAEIVAAAREAPADGPVLGGAAASSGPPRPAVRDTAGRFGMVVRDARHRAEARRGLLGSARKETDGFVSRTLNRPISLRLSTVFIRLGLTPNQISVGNLVLGLIGALFAAAGGYWNTFAGGLLFQFSSVLDGSDGEVAKLTYNCSEKGSWIDTLCDELTCLAFFAALPVGLYRSTGRPAYLALVGGTLLSGAVLYALMIRHVSRRRDHGSMVQILDDFREGARQPGLAGRITAAVSSLDFVVRRDFFAFAIMVLCLLGRGDLVVWTVGILTPLAALYFAWFSLRWVRSPSRCGEGVAEGGPKG